MSRTQTTLLFLGLLALLALSPAALAQSTDQGDEVIVPQKTIIQITETDEITGTRATGEGLVVQSRQITQNPSLIRVRGNFNAEIAKTVDDL